MPPKGIAYHLIFLSSASGAVFYHPIMGLIGYLVTYQINAMKYWWAISALRYSMLIYLCTIFSVFVYGEKLKYKQFFEGQEILMIIYLMIIYFSLLFGLPGTEGMAFADKMTKVTVMLLIASHVLTDEKLYRVYLWTIVLIGLYLGYEMYNAPGWMFRGGRYHAGIGGTDFNEGNFLGIHFAILLPFIGIFFIQGNWKMKVLTGITGALVMNSVAQVRSRGCFLALIVGAIVAFLFPRPLKRTILIVLLMIGALGIFMVTDDAFWTRMETIETSEDEMDASAMGRVVAWKASVEMVFDYPLGVGVGNFGVYIGRYVPDLAGRDSHSTYFRCLAELGFPGIFVLFLLIFNAFRLTHSLQQEIDSAPGLERMTWYVFALRIALAIHVFGSLTITHTYIEDFYWLLIHPVFLKRTIENEKDRLEESAALSAEMPQGAEAGAGL